ncbi:MAG: VCBS repeat-containing protein [Bryobacteraceae bacterium]|nr:VCBS repeat-containing protein [Bryobacteraceae bacterium]MDW8379791.1 VCBS repeat-containing protein [Bryobacterales bacterium]
MRGILLCLAAASIGWGQIQWVERALPLPSLMRGATGHPRDPFRAWMWGEGIFSLNLVKLEVQPLRPGSFAAPGCTFQNGLALIALPDRFSWFEGDDFHSEAPIDSEAEFADCLDVNLFGRSGILVTHRGMQIRFYQPDKPRWRSREIYSFYTASYQSGLLVFDVDADNRVDIVSGNYWIRSPAAFHLPWRLFAIHTYFEQPQSARMRLARIRRGGSKSPSLLAVQSEMYPARLALFDPPGDVRQLWKEHALQGELLLDHPRTLAVADFDGDGFEDFLLAESRGTGRIWWWRQGPSGFFRPKLIACGEPVLTGWVSDVNGDRRPDIVLAESRRMRWLINQPLQ